MKYQTALISRDGRIHEVRVSTKAAKDALDALTGADMNFNTYHTIVDAIFRLDKANTR